MALLALASENVTAISWTLAFVLDVITLSVFGTSAAFVLWFSLLRRASLSQLNVFTFLTPIFGIAMGTMFFSEEVGSAEIAGIGFSLLGIYWVTRPALVRRSGTETAGVERHRNG